MIIQPYWKPVGELFEEDLIFRVPTYQRGYAWGAEQIEDFIGDLWKCYAARSKGEQRHHLFGGIVSAEGTTPGTDRKNYELIDGQQRLATFVILVHCLVASYQKLSQLKGGNKERARRAAASSRAKQLTSKYLEYKQDVGGQTVRIDRFYLSKRDHPFFKDLVANLSPPSTRESHKNLEHAFKTIASRLNGTLDTQRGIAKKLAGLKRFEAVIDEDCTVIHIVSDERAEAYRLFQILNDRGTSLTEGDLLRARTLEMLAPTQFADQQRTVELSWDTILVDPPEFTRDFLMWFHASVNGKRPSKTSLFDNFLDAQFPQHTKTTLSKANAQDVVSRVRQIEKEVVVCRKLIDAEWPYPQAKPIAEWDKDRLRMLIKGLDHKLCMPLLLAAYNNVDQRKFSEIVQLVERFAFRYKNISNQHVTPLTKVYHQNAVAIRDVGSTYKVSKLRDDLRALQTKKTPDSLFRSALKNQLVYNKAADNRTLRYFLVNAEYYFKWYEAGASGKPKGDKTVVFDFLRATIEHVYPLNPDVRDSKLDPLVNELGNLTFLGPEDNDKAGSKEFAFKKPIFARSVLVNREIAKASSWDVTAIEARANTLTDLALKVFRV